jgi:hypothetical protein
MEGGTRSPSSSTRRRRARQRGRLPFSDLRGAAQSGPRQSPTARDDGAEHPSSRLRRPSLSHCLTLVSAIGSIKQLLDRADLPVFDGSPSLFVSSPYMSFLTSWFSSPAPDAPAPAASTSKPAALPSNPALVTELNPEGLKPCVLSLPVPACWSCGSLQLLLHGLPCAPCWTPLTPPARSLGHAQQVLRLPGHQVEARPVLHGLGRRRGRLQALHRGPSGVHARVRLKPLPMRPHVATGPRTGVINDRSSR